MVGEAKFCAGCGRQRTAGAAFCAYCGRKFGPSVPPAATEAPPAGPEPRPAPVVPAPVVPGPVDPAPTMDAPRDPAPTTYAPPTTPEAPSPRPLPVPSAPDAGSSSTPEPQSADEPALRALAPFARVASSTRNILMTTVACVFLCTAVTVWYFALRPAPTEQASYSVSTRVASPAQSVTPSPDSTSIWGEPSSTPPSPSTSSTPPELADVMAPSAKECGRYGRGAYSAVASGNPVTSCDFAKAVRASYLAGGLDGRDGEVMAYSPVTQKDYTMRCTGTGIVRCTGGNNALVIIYGGQLKSD